MRRLAVISLLLVVAACDRSTPRLIPPSDEPTASPTPSSTVAIGTVPPTGQPTTQTKVAMPKPPSDAIEARVARVSDGDTIVLTGIHAGELDRSTGGRKARVIGVDTPEVFGRAECYGREASAFTKRELDGTDVLVDFDVDTIDRYGRALVYVWSTDGRFFNGRLVAEGYALQATFSPNVRYVELFTRLVRDAREHERGLWAPRVC